MSHAHLHSTAPVRVASQREMLHCRSCSRSDWHKPVAIHWTVAALLIVATAGIAWFFRPYRCTCCGKIRPRHQGGDR